MNFLSDEERANLKWQHKRERDRRICDRIKAVLLYDKGWSLKEIAEALLLTEESIRLHIDEYTTSKKLKPEGEGSVEKLSAEQSQQLEAHLQKHTYLFIKDIAAYVQSMWGIAYTVHGLRNWLHRHGFSYKKPAVVPGKADEQRQKEWIAEYEN
jgi:transposase